MKNAAPLMKTVRRQLGAATVEFYVIAFFAFIPLMMAIFQLGMFMVAKNTVNTAALAVARAGGASGGDKAAMYDAFASGVVPLYASTGLSLVQGNSNKEISIGNYPLVYSTALARAKLELLLPTNKITVLNPTAKSFIDFGVDKPGVGRIIPHTNFEYDMGVVGASSGQTRADALLLKVQVQYCYELVFPIIDVMITKLLQLQSLDLASQACYLNPATGRRGIPIVSQAVVRMTVPPVKGRFP